MASNSRYCDKVAALFTLLPIVIVLICFYYLEYHLHALSLPFDNGEGNLPRDTFVTTAVATDIQGPFNDTALGEFCRKVKWVPGLIFSCALSHGGIGNVRNMFNTCLRYALEAGATGFLTPQVSVRHADGTIGDGDIVEMDYFFDRDHFVSMLGTTCPKMVVYNTSSEILGYVSSQRNETDGHGIDASNAESLATRHSTNLVAWDLYGPRVGLPLHPDRWDHNFGDWRGNFDHWLEEQDKTFTEKPVIVSIEKAFSEFPIHHDKLHFINTFGRLFEFPHDIRTLAAITLHTLSQRFSLNINPAEGMVGRSSRGNSQRSKGYFGAHLRSEPDIVRTGWDIGSFDVQSKHLLDQAAAGGHQVIYLASGSVEDSARFKRMAWDEYGIHVTSKDDLLLHAAPPPIQSQPKSFLLPFPTIADTPRHKLVRLPHANITSTSPTEPEAKPASPIQRQLASLTWDQQALIDYLMLLKATGFGGNSYSSFSWQVAIKRHALSRDVDYLSGSGGGGREGGYGNADSDENKDGADDIDDVEWALKDEYSTIYGRAEYWWFYPVSMWP